MSLKTKLVFPAMISAALTAGCKKAPQVATNVEKWAPKVEQAATQAAKNVPSIDTAVFSKLTKGLEKWQPEIDKLNNRILYASLKNYEAGIRHTLDSLCTKGANGPINPKIFNEIGKYLDELKKLRFDEMRFSLENSKGDLSRIQEQLGKIIAK